MFKVGDKVITAKGEVGVITDICTCDGCKERGFNEPQIETIIGNYTIMCTDSDKRDNFKSFYSIGGEVYGNLDYTELIVDMARTKRQIKDKQNELEQLEKQYEFLSRLSERELFKKSWGKE